MNAKATPVKHLNELEDVLDAPVAAEFRFHIRCCSTTQCWSDGDGQMKGAEKFRF